MFIEFQSIPTFKPISFIGKFIGSLPKVYQSKHPSILQALGELLRMGQQRLLQWEIASLRINITVSTRSFRHKQLLDLMEGKNQIVFILGGPGSGKGTQSALIDSTYGFKHLSAGDLLREERKSGSENGDLIENCIKEGTIVPSWITVKLLDNAMVKSGGKKFLIDGFPRNQENLQSWTQLMGEKNETLFVIHLKCSEETMIDRLLNRGVNSGRVDDNIQSIKKRLNTAKVETGPIIEHFRGLEKLAEVGSEAPINEVFDQFKPYFQKIN